MHIIGIGEIWGYSGFCKENKYTQKKFFVSLFLFIFCEVFLLENVRSTKLDVTYGLLSGKINK